MSGKAIADDVLALALEIINLEYRAGKGLESMTTVGRIRLDLLPPFNDNWVALEALLRQHCEVLMGKDPNKWPVRVMAWAMRSGGLSPAMGTVVIEKRLPGLPGGYVAIGFDSAQVGS